MWYFLELVIRKNQVDKELDKLRRSNSFISFLLKSRNASFDSWFQPKVRDKKLFDLIYSSDLFLT